MEMIFYQVVVENLLNMMKDLLNKEEEKNKNKNYLIIEIYVNN